MNSRSSSKRCNRIMTQQETIQEDVEAVQELISDDHDVEDEEIEEHLQDFYEFGVKGEQARNSTISKIANDRGLSRNELLSQQGGEGGVVPLSTLGDGDWGNVRAVVVDLWESKSDAVAQKGLIDDGDVSRAFVVWSGGTEDVPELEEGETYLFKSVVGNEDDRDNIQIQVNRASEVTASDEAVEPSGGEVEFTGAILDTQGASGLVWRDAETERVVDSNEGDVEHDLRLILAMDDGHDVYRVHFDRELTEELTGITLDEAQEIAMDAMDREAVISDMLPELIGRYMTVHGNLRDDYIFVEEYEWAEDVSGVDELLIKARSLN